MFLPILVFVAVVYILYQARYGTTKTTYDEYEEPYESVEFNNTFFYTKAKFISAICSLGANLCKLDLKDYGKKNIEIRRYVKKVFPDEIDIREELALAIRYQKTTESVCVWLKRQKEHFDELELIIFCVRLVSIDGLVSSKEEAEIDFIAKYLDVEKIEYQQYIDYVNNSYQSRQSSSYSSTRPSITTALNYFGFDKTPTVKELKDRFRQKVKSCHPDLFSSASDSEKKILESKFNELQKYYNEILVEIG